MRTPALVFDLDALEANVRRMAMALPGPRLRPHVKAHTCTALARLQRDLGGHRGFTCATVREVVGLAAAGLGDDLLLADEVLDCSRIGAIADHARVTVTVDSIETIQAAASGGVREVLVDVDVGLPQCGCAPGDAGPARRSGARRRPRGPRGHGLRGPRDRGGDRVRVIPAHVDPTVAYHERALVVRGDTVVDECRIDLRGW